VTAKTPGQPEDNAGAGAPTGLSYLHPSRLRLGGIGVFAGDWAWTGDPPRIPTGFVGLFTDTWNGWAVFSCTRQVAEAIVVDHNRQREQERTRLAAMGLTGEDLDAAVDDHRCPMYFDGDILVCDESQIYGEQSITSIAPDADGRYTVQGYHWTWTAVDPADCEHIAGIIPPYGQHQQFVYLPHTGLRVPHDRLRVTSVALPPIPEGRTAGLRVSIEADGREAGSFEGSTSEGLTFHPTGDALGHEGWQQFVAECRWHGQPTDQQQVLKSLIREHLLEQEIASAETQGQVLVRVRDTDGELLGSGAWAGTPSMRHPATQDAIAALTAMHAPEHPHAKQFIWEYWNGRSWRHVTVTHAPHSGQ
jgi:hypothetical protein